MYKNLDPLQVSPVTFLGCNVFQHEHEEVNRFFCRFDKILICQMSSVINHLFITQKF